MVRPYSWHVLFDDIVEYSGCYHHLQPLQVFHSRSVGPVHIPIGIKRVVVVVIIIIISICYTGIPSQKEVVFESVSRYVRHDLFSRYLENLIVVVVVVVVFIYLILWM